MTVEWLSLLKRKHALNGAKTQTTAIAWGPKDPAIGVAGVGFDPTTFGL